MKRFPLAVLAASLLIATQAGYAATQADAASTYPPDAGPTLTPEQLRLQLQRLTPQERQQVLRDIAPGFRPGFAGPGARQGRGFGPGDANGSGPNGPVRRPGQGPQFREGGNLPNQPQQPGFGQDRRPGRGPGAPGGPLQGGPGQGVQRPVINRLAEIANLPPEQRAANLNQMHQRVNNRLAELRRQRESGNLPPEQQQQLQMLQNLSQRIEELSQLPPEELRARLDTLRNGARQGPAFRGGDAPDARPRRPQQDPGPGAGAPERPRRPFAPPENDPYGLPPQPRPQGGDVQPRPQN